MKYPFYLIYLFLAAAMLAGCKEDFDTEAPYKPVTIVYGLLDAADSTHYIRIQKTYSAANASAYIPATNVDSNIDKSIVVLMRELSKSGKTISETTLSLIDFNLEGIQKKPGIFFDDYNYAYKYEKTLDTSNRYRLVIFHPQTGVKDSVETGILYPLYFTLGWHEKGSTLPGSLLMNALLPGQEAMNYAAFGVPAGSNICWCMLDINYTERNTNTGTTEQKSVPYYMPFTNHGYGSAFYWENPASVFYHALGQHIKQAGPEIERRLIDCDLSAYAGTPELNRYANFDKAFQTGLAGTSMGTSYYTNIRSSGTALGVFTSITTKTYLNNSILYSLDSLKKNINTKNLNFK